MNEGSLLGEIWRENRLLIIILSVITIGLAVTLGVMMIVKNNMDNAINSVEIVEKSHQEEASESELDLDLYYDDIYSVIYHICRYKMDDCVIEKGKLLDDGTWYVTTITKPIANRWSLPEDKYRVILHKTAGVWKIVAGPGLVFSYGEFPDIPRGVIASANNL